ncbi:MAG: GNAT family N-acetyltransferase [Silicimonas sp.]|nr:GNAT family N-acetyltransferase [Silicimonas sp.]
MSGNPITIRNLGPEDAFVLDRVRPGTFDHMPDPDRVWSFLATRVNELVVALDQGEVVGFAFGTVMMRPDKPTAFYLDEVGVHEDYRRQGIARRLLARIRELARDRGCESFWLGTEGDNAAALALYRALGGREMSGVSVFEWDLD